MPETYTPVGGLLVSDDLYRINQDEISIGKPISALDFWKIVERINNNHGAKNAELMQVRTTKQHPIDDYCRAHKGQPWDSSGFFELLKDIDYLAPEVPDFQVETPDVDGEVLDPSPQLVTPGDKPRFVANAVNNWRTGYDTFYGKKEGTNVIPLDLEATIGEAYNPHRGAQVMAFANQYLDEVFPLAEGSHAYARQYKLEKSGERDELVAVFADSTETKLADPYRFAGYNRGDNGELTNVLLEINGSHADLLVDRKEQRAGMYHPAGIYEMLIQAARTVIIDKEDAVVAVDGADLAVLFSVWDKTMRGTLESTKEKDGLDRKLDPDRTYISPEGKEFTLRGRALALSRNVSLHMYTEAVKTASGEPIPQAFLEDPFTVYSALHDINRDSKYVNSENGHIYIVVPKLHSPEEVAAKCAEYSDLEKEFGLKEGTILIGLMDEEASMSATLKESIYAAKDRVFFINTGFLDRSASQIRTFFYYGSVVTKEQMRNHIWRKEYEIGNVRVGLETFLHEHGQLGKGMHVEADDMALLYKTKPAHIEAGASTGWVADPKAAAWFATIIHKYNVSDIQAKLLAEHLKPNLEAILTPPVMTQDEISQLTKEEIHHHVMEWAQGILGYTSRVVSMGIGCSKVPDLKQQALMEDRATLREKSLSIANWIEHGLISKDEADAIMETMAIVVDLQNKGEPGYVPMANNLDGHAFKAAQEIIARAAEGPDGYVEEILWKYRRQVKEKLQ